MKKIIITLNFIFFAISAMEPESPEFLALTPPAIPAEIPNARFININPMPVTQRSRSNHSFDGSYEQRFGFWLSGLTTLTSIGYVSGRVTPRHVHDLFGADLSNTRPLCDNLFGADEPAPEREGMFILAPFCLMLACASSAEPDHSCCLGKTRLFFNKLKEISIKLKNTLCIGDRYEFDLNCQSDSDGIPLVPGLIYTSITPVEKKNQ